MRPERTGVVAWDQVTDRAAEEWPESTLIIGLTVHRRPLSARTPESMPMGCSIDRRREARDEFSTSTSPRLTITEPGNATEWTPQSHFGAAPGVPTLGAMKLVGSVGAPNQRFSIEQKHYKSFLSQ